LICSSITGTTNKGHKFLLGDNPRAGHFNFITLKRFHNEKDEKIQVREIIPISNADERGKGGF